MAKSIARYQLNREVAIPVLPDHLSDNPEWWERFEREVRAINKKNGPHIFQHAGRRCTDWD
jgi:hypothetical protein